jgi:predicted transcriptional regulator
MEERRLPETEGLLGSKTTIMAADGAILKVVRTPFCDACGQMLTDKPAICSCKRKICPACTIFHEGRAYCRDCAKQITAITKQAFFVLYGIANKASIWDIKHSSSMSLDVIYEIIDALTERELISVKGMLLFTTYSATDKGLAILATAEQIYKPEPDVALFLEKIRELTEDL